ncbi:MAG TPA: arylsulfotransferase family protein [Solirubrobacteraceae bacterium]
MSDTRQIDETPEAGGVGPGSGNGIPASANGAPTADPEPERARRGGLTRRQFIPGAAGLVAALGVGGVAGYELRGGGSSSSSTAPKSPPPGAPGSGRDSFVTRNDLLPALVSVNDFAGANPAEASPRFIVLAPMPIVAYEGEQRGPMLLDRRGRMVWYRPGPDSTFDVQIQQYRGKPVLTWWHGNLVGGHGEGVGEIIDGSYSRVATVGDAEKLPLDLHEFTLTSRGTALATQFEQKQVDLSSIGGSKRGVALIGHALEIDIATNKVLLDWNSLDHVSLKESYVPAPSDPTATYDFFHINSVAETDDGHLLISGRNTWTLYKVHRTTGQVLWRLGGKRDDFAVPKPTWFSWQHHARVHGAGEISLFDNANTSGHGSLAKLLSVDETARRVELKRSYQHPAKFVATSLGSVQTHPDGNVFVGWGAQPYASEFTADGKLIYDVQFTGPFRSYRTFLADWEGRPTDKPAVAARTQPGGGFAVFASWNGATEIDHWLVLAGNSSSSLREVGSQAWSGFETMIVVNSSGPAFAVAAIDHDGNELGRSDVV